MILSMTPKAVSSIMGLYSPSFVAKLKSHGILWLATATTVAEARAAKKAGADAVIAQGMEAGGHRGAFQAESAERQMVGLIAPIPQIATPLQFPSSPRAESLMLAESQLHWSWARAQYK